MTDTELVDFLGISDSDMEPEIQMEYILSLSEERRALFEKMHDLVLWDKGLGPLPGCVIICKRH